MLNEKKKHENHQDYNYMFDGNTGFGVSNNGTANKYGTDNDRKRK